MLVSRRFVEQAIRRKQLYLRLSIAGVMAGALLAAYFAVQSGRDPGYELGPRMVLVIFVLLNARGNLRQFKFATALEQLSGPENQDTD